MSHRQPSVSIARVISFTVLGWHFGKKRTLSKAAILTWPIHIAVKVKKKWKEHKMPDQFRSRSLLACSKLAFLTGLCLFFALTTALSGNFKRALNSLPNQVFLWLRSWFKAGIPGIWVKCKVDKGCVLIKAAGKSCGATVPSLILSITTSYLRNRTSLTKYDVTS